MCKTNITDEYFSVDKNVYMNNSGRSNPYIFQDFCPLFLQDFGKGWCSSIAENNLASVFLFIVFVRFQDSCLFSTHICGCYFWLQFIQASLKVKFIVEDLLFFTEITWKLFCWRFLCSFEVLGVLNRTAQRRSSYHLIWFPYKIPSATTSQFESCLKW